MVDFTDEDISHIKDSDEEKKAELLALTRRLYRGDIKIGEEVNRYTNLGYKSKRAWYKGTVVYIHPRHRFHTVEYDMPNGYKIRECFKGTARKHNAMMEVIE